MSPCFGLYSPLACVCAIPLRSGVDESLRHEANHLLDAVSDAVRDIAAQLDVVVADVRQVCYCALGHWLCVLLCLLNPICVWRVLSCSCVYSAVWT